MARNDKMNIWQILALYIMSIFIYVIIVASVSGTNLSGIADIVVEGLIIFESIILIIIIALKALKVGKQASKNVRR